MRRLMASLAVVGITAFLFGLMVPRSLRENLLVADSSVEPPQATAQVVSPPAVKTHADPFSRHHDPAISTPVVSDNAEQAEEDPFSVSVGELPEVKNRFDRDRPDAEFDSEPPRSLSLDVADAGNTGIPPRPRPPGPKVPDVDSLESTFQPTPASPRSIPRTAATPDPLTANRDVFLNDTRFVSAGIVSKQPTPPRVTLVLTPDHQIRILAENKSAAATQALLAVGEILITAEEFNLTPPTEPKSGNQIQCSGNVQIRSQQFNGIGTKLSLHKDNVVLEGSQNQPAVIVKLVNPATNLGAGSDPAEFRLSARKITFTPTLDKLQVDNSVTISPTAPATPAPAGAIPNAAEPKVAPVAEDSFLPPPAQPAPESKPTAPPDDEFNLPPMPGESKPMGST